MTIQGSCQFVAPSETSSAEGVGAGLPSPRPCDGGAEIEGYQDVQISVDVMSIHLDSHVEDAQ